MSLATEKKTGVVSQFRRAANDTGSPEVCSRVATPALRSAVNHRGAPRFHYPAAIEDVQRAIRFVRANAQRSGATPLTLTARSGAARALWSVEASEWAALTDEQVAAVRNGQAVRAWPEPAVEAGRRVRLYGPGGVFLGLAEARPDGVLQPRRLMRSSAS